MSSAGLSDADERAFKVFLRFVGRTDEANWEWSAQDACDLLISNGWDALPGAPSHLHEPVLALVGDSDLRESEVHLPVLPRPLQMDDFSELLRRVESGRACRGQRVGALEPARPESPIRDPAPPPPAPPPPATPATPAATPAPLSPAALAPVLLREARPAEPAPAAVRPPAGDAPAQRLDRYRLVRWPKAEFLRGRARATRFLSFLASGYLSVEQLCTLSGADKPTCTALLDALDAAGYLETRPARAPVAAASPPARSIDRPAEPRPAAAAPDIGLFGRLRRRLGLG